MSSIDNQYTDQAETLSEYALGELQLSRQPFTAAAQSGDTFVDDIAEAQLDDIKQALISGDDLLLILGPEGSGKSTLLNQLGAKSGQRIQCFSVRGSERFSTANLFAGMIEAFKKQPPDDLKLMLDELIPCLQGMADHNTLGAVVLDDADLIPEAELTKLLSGMLYLNSSDETLLRVTLAAPTEFEERIPELLPEGADLPYSSLAIEAFDKDRSAAYLDYRLQQAGLTDAFPFNEAELASINEEAGGRPGYLHTVAARHLNTRDENFVSELPPELKDNASEKKAATGKSFGKFGGTKLVAGALAVAMILAGLFWLKPSGNTVPDDRYKVVENKKLETDTNNTEVQRLAQERKEAATDAAKKAAEKLAAQQQAAEQQAAQNEADLPTVAIAETSTNAQANDTTQAGNNTQTSSTVDNAATIAANAEAAKAEAQLQAKLEREAAQKETEEKLAKEKLAAEQAAAAKLAEQSAAQEKIAKAAAAKPVEDDTTTDNSEADAQSAANNLESPNWILTQNPSLFTVQMSASKDRKSVESFLASTELEPPNSIFSFNRNGATWYALVHGLYNNIEDARKDIEKMPERTRSNQPWIRAVGRIQKAMKEQ